MEEKNNLIREKLTGNRIEDIEYLNVLLDANNRVLEETLATIKAINTVLNELNSEQPKEEIKEDNTEIEEKANDEVIDNNAKDESEENSEERNEIDRLIDELTLNIENENTEEALKIIEVIIPKIEAISKGDNKNVLYCSFSTDFEKMIFKNIFGGEKEVKDTPYANDIVYIMYADILLKKKRRKAAMDALDRAIYWNFLSRDARAKKIDLYYSKQEIVKCLEAIKKLQMISYTAKDIAECYNKYAFVFNSLKDPKSAYALYRLSYSYYEDSNVLEMIDKYEQENPSFKELTSDEIINITLDNEVEIGPNSKILKAHREITTNLIEIGAIEEAKIMLQNDYSMTKDDTIASIYTQLNELYSDNKEENKEDKENEKVVEEIETKTEEEKETELEENKLEENKLEENKKEEKKKVTKKSTKSKSDTKKETAPKTTNKITRKSAKKENE